MARVANSMVTFQDLDDMVTFEGFSYVANPITPPSNLNKLATKVELLGYLDVNLSRNLANNQLVSYSIIVLPTVTDELTLSPKNNTINSSAQNYVVTVESNTAWTVSESLNWASLSATSGSGNGSITVTLLENTSTDERSGSITFSTGDVNESHQIRQIGVAEELSISPSSAINLPASNPSNIGVNVTSNTSWSVVTTPPNWFTVTGGSGSGNGSFTIDPFTNTSGSSRSFSLTIQTTGSNPASETFIISQIANEELSLSPTSAPSPANNPSSIGIAVTSNASWLAGSTPGWINIEGGSGTGNGSFVFNPSTNTGSARSFTLTVQTQGANPASATFTITQAAAQTLTISPTSNTVNSSLSTYVISILSNANWTISESLSWIGVSEFSGFGDEDVTVTVSDNPNSFERIGDIVFATDNVTKTHEVTQEGETVGQLYSHYVAEGSTASNACSNSPSITVWSESSDFGNSQKLFSNSSGSSTVFSGFYSREGLALQCDNSGDVINSDLCF